MDDPDFVLGVTFRHNHPRQKHNSSIAERQKSKFLSIILTSEAPEQKLPANVWIGIEASLVKDQEQIRNSVDEPAPIRGLPPIGVPHLE